MCLRKLAAGGALLMAAPMVLALNPVEAAPVTVAALEATSKVALGGITPVATAEVRRAAGTPPTSARPAAPAEREPNAPRDLKALTALLGGLALVGWFQRRRSQPR
ncbi:hypothetical protein [Roseateles terrae]|uniref:MYXO-CTERM domain-containing protein n=1 Tax=Roseateles terrae TaxID=431060 RepID=A0ABR6GKT6_9BURK|nr:hypothetical protein [Roseateles terrae]MBB3192711.1 hypothetical protein [Roseateles terrae]OWQ90008.1 hypothetical protein CDN98_05860 [Roseateles terrae]